MNIRLILVAAFFWPTCALSIGYPSFKSEIPGVQLWVLNTGEAGFPQEGFEGGQNEFIRHCNGTRSIHVGSVSSPIRCKTETTSSSTHHIQLIAKDRNLSGLVVVSKVALPSRTKPMPLTEEESEKLTKIEKAVMMASANEAKRNYMNSYSATEADYAKMLREIKTSAAYRKHGNARFKISAGDNFIYISAVGPFPDGLGWNIKNAVFREIDGKLKAIGSFSGCIEGFRDLNGDGIPEVLTRLCENSEGTVDQFWSLTPVIRPVVTRSQ